uniref:Distal membrane-arm assembly complex protein 1-like domain-containing protein n=1 Tax=Pyxicephalus adspersus TaxID=30357 RepID=A0AAV3A5M1_PYXAD|nr:TPA: hypothetical protein GDO54_002747 [Pyxicephalus adspersus]
MSSKGSGAVVGQLQKKDCWSCQVIGGSGLIVAGGYVYYHGRKLMRPGYISPISTIPIMFAMGLVSLGTTLVMKAVVPN